MVKSKCKSDKMTKSKCKSQKMMRQWPIQIKKLKLARVRLLLNEIDEIIKIQKSRKIVNPKTIRWATIVVHKKN